MTDDEFAAAFMGSASADRAETLRQVEQFKRSRPEALRQVRLDAAASEEIRRRAADQHDQLDSAHWLATQLADLLSREGRLLDQEWAGEVCRALRVLSAHFLASDPE